MEKVKVTIKFIGALSADWNKKEDELTVSEDTTVRQLLEILGQRYGDSFENRVWGPQRQLSSDFKVFMGQDEISTSGLDTLVKPSSISLFFLQAMAGGAK